MKRNIKLLASIILVMFVIGCAANISVKRPDVEQMNKVAVVSVYSNPGLYNADGGGGLTALASFITKKAGAKGVDFGGTRLVEFGLESFSSELDKVDAWEVVSSDSVMNAEAYKAFIDDYNANAKKYGNKAKASFTVVPGMVSVVVGPKLDRDLVKRLAELARSLNVDAVAVVHLDLAYRASTSIGGTGTAAASVASNLSIVSKDGEIIVSTPWQIDGGKGVRKSSSSTTGLVAGELIYSTKAETMFKDAIEQNAAYFKAQIVGK